MSSSAATSTYNPYSGKPTFTATASGPSLVGGTLTSAYLYLLIGLGIVPTIVFSFLFIRTHFLRRRVRRSIQESLRTGAPLPFETAFALGWAVPEWKRPVPIKRSPEFWEVKQKREVGDGKGGWGEITPVSVTCASVPRFTYTLPSAGRKSISTRMRHPFQVNNLPPEILKQAMALHQFHQGTLVQGPRERFRSPETGEEVTVGVLIAMPEWEDEGKTDEEEERVREVCLGVLDVEVVKW